MSMSHGDFDYDYLERLVLDKRGRPRLKRISFAGHFDMMMFGRRGIPRASSERELNPYRQRFVDMFKRLRAKHGVRFFLAHNMTVTPANLGQVADLVRDCHTMGFGMFSFQPAAFVGDNRRWHENYEQVGMEEVWREIEKGAGTPLDYTVIQHGDLRCNRVAYGFCVGPQWHPFLSGDPGDLAAREAFFRYFGETNFAGVELPDVIGKVARTIVRHPVVVVIAAQWLARLVRRVGGLPALLRHGVRPVSFVVHQFMDAADVAPAWELMQRGEKATEPRVLAAQERLASCHYAMAHPESGELVPACVQHCVLDPVENIELRKLLPIVQTCGS
jgi:hypothetical protein